MATESPTESDPLFQLLTEALRAGPGSTPWRDALAQLSQPSGVSGEAEQYRTILQAREHLASGREYRSVRAGAGFTRKLLDAIEKDGARRPAASISTAISIISAVAIVAVLCVVVFLLSRSGKSGDTDIEKLAVTYFPARVASADFSNGIPAAFHTVGKLPLLASNGLTPGGSPALEGDRVDGGAAVLTQPVPADQPFAVEVKVEPPAGDDPVIAQVFVANSNDLDADRATAPQELVWLAQRGRQRLMVDAHVQADEAIPANGPTPLTVRLIVNAEVVVAEVGGKRLWAGEHRLGRDKPRYVGVRFLRRAGKGESHALIRSIMVSKLGADSSSAAN